MVRKGSPVRVRHERRIRTFSRARIASTCSGESGRLLVQLGHEPDAIRTDQVARVMIEITGAAWSADALALPEDTRQALETDGRTEVLKVLGDDHPPRIIRCGSTGCAYLSAAR